FFQAEDGIRDATVTGVQTCALPISTVFVAGAIGLVALTGIWPPRTGVEGTIGGANRYRAQQIKESDVQLADADLQAFIQTDTFQIGRASCRERVWVWTEDVTVDKAM